MTAPAVAADVVYVGAGNPHPRVQGRPHLRHRRLHEHRQPRCPGTYIWPIVFGSCVYVATDGGTVAALKLYP